MSGNIAVVGAVINLSNMDAAQTFAPTIGHQAALVRGFGYDEQAVLLKAKSLLMLVTSTTIFIPSSDLSQHTSGRQRCR